jgi:hypothetical protein
MKNMQEMQPKERKQSVKRFSLGGSLDFNVEKFEEHSRRVNNGMALFFDSKHSETNLRTNL